MKFFMIIGLKGKAELKKINELPKFIEVIQAFLLDILEASRFLKVPHY